MPITDMQALKERFAASSRGGYHEWKPKYGADKDHAIENKIKLFSWPPEGGQLGKRVYQHGALGADGKKTAFCMKTFGVANFCPVCDYIDRAGKSQDAGAIARAEKLAQRERYLMIVADLDALDKEKTKVVGIYNSSPGFYRRCIQEMTSENYDFTGWTSLPVKIICHRRGPGLPSSVEFGTAMREVTLDPAEWMPLMPKLDQVIAAPPPNSLVLLLEGREMDETDEVPMKHPTDPQPTQPTQAAAPQPQQPTQQPAPQQPATQPQAAQPEASHPAPKRTLQDLLKKK